MSQSQPTKLILKFALFSLIVLFILPVFFTMRGLTKGQPTPTALAPPIIPPPIPPVVISNQPIARMTQTQGLNNTSEFKELESILAIKGTSICGVLKTIDSRKQENFKIALAKHPGADSQQGQLLMELNQETLNEVKAKYDIDRRVLGTIFRLGSSVCK